MKATKVDKDLCIGCGLCCGICDEVFRMNEQGKAEAYQPANAENQGAVQEAIDSCPCVCNRLGRLIRDYEEKSVNNNLLETVSSFV